jgi:hypothetical protein
VAKKKKKGVRAGDVAGSSADGRAAGGPCVGGDIEHAATIKKMSNTLPTSKETASRLLSFDTHTGRLVPYVETGDGPITPYTGVLWSYSG